MSTNETSEEREAARQRGYRERVLPPSVGAQERYPLAEYPCAGCNRKLPHLVDNGSEFYWEHHLGGRSHCHRFGRDTRGRPRPGTATSLWHTDRNWNPLLRTEDEYVLAHEAVEHDEADDAALRTAPPGFWERR